MILLPFYIDDLIKTALSEDIHYIDSTADLLIDDRDGNIADWCAAGGRGIVFHDAGGVIKDLTSGTF